MGVPRRNEYCTHCGLYTTHRLVLAYRRWAAIPQSFGSDLAERIGDLTDCDAGFGYRSYYVGICESCFELTLYINNPPIERETDLFESRVTVRTWPPLDYFSEEVPEDVRRYWSEAQRIRKSSFDSYVVNARKALEAICDDKGIPKGGLGNRLKQLAFTSTIPPVVQDMADVLRQLGNIGAHSGRRITEDEAEAVEKFLRWIVEYVYIAPSQLKQLRQAIAKIVSSSLETDEQEAQKDKRHTIH